MNSRLKVLAKRFKMSEITTSTSLTFRDLIADVTYCVDVTPFLHATSGGQSLTASFSLL